jgi:hypothetical protein
MHKDHHRHADRADEDEDEDEEEAKGADHHEGAEALLNLAMLASSTHLCPCRGQCRG